jgi:hypothetical protein
MRWNGYSGAAAARAAADAMARAVPRRAGRACAGGRCRLRGGVKQASPGPGGSSAQKDQ